MADTLTDTGSETVSSPELDYHALNAMLNLYNEAGEIQFDKDREAANQYFLQHVNQNTVYFHDLEEKIDYLVRNKYYDPAVIEAYDFEFIKSLFKRAYSYKFRFKSFLGAYKYYTSYTLKTFDGKRYLDANSGLWNMVAGFDHKGLAEAAKAQYDRFPGYHAFFGRMSDQTVMLSEKLVEVSPYDYGRVFYTNSGSEANDTMVKMLWFLHRAEGKPERRKILTRKNAYHGVTAVSASMISDTRLSLGPSSFSRAAASRPMKSLSSLTNRSIPAS